MTVRYGSPILSDEIGNMLSDGTWTYTWEHGRELVSMYGEMVDGNKDISISYPYDANGLRTKRSDGSYSHTYVHNGGRLGYMTINGSKLFSPTIHGLVPSMLTVRGSNKSSATNTYLKTEAPRIWGASSCLLRN